MINYPNGKKKTFTKTIQKTDASHRGMELESEINQSNQYYLSYDCAIIHKKPTPVTIVKVDYPMRTAAKITEAYFKVPSTTDYNGIYKGRYIDFEAKECSSKTSFPIKSIHPHQIAHLKSVAKHGAISFVIIRFTTLNETYYIDSLRLIHYIETCNRSSVPYTWFKENGILIQYRYQNPVDYLSVIDQLYFKENNK